MLERLIGLYKECFPEDNEQTVQYMFKHILGEQNALYTFDNGNLASALYLVDKTLYLKKNTISLPYIVALGTAKEYRKKGYAEKLIESTLNVLYSCQVPFIALYPFKHSFYEKFHFITPSYDYSLVGEKTQCEISKAEEIYSGFCKELDYYIVREDSYYKMKKEMMSSDNDYFFEVINDNLTVGYTNSEESIPLTYHKGTEKGTMVRIVNAVNALYISKLTFEKKVRLTDDMIADNNFTFRLYNGEVTLTDTYDITIDITRLGEIIFGQSTLEGEKCDTLKGYLADKY